ncbi:MAG: hypothetical protein ACE5GB_02730 [Acidimicrobiales bacterium]
MIAGGAGSGFAQPPLTGSLANAIEDADLGVGTGMMSMLGPIVDPPDLDPDLDGLDRSPRAGPARR